MARRAVGIDIGGTGIKGAVVDVKTGTLLSDRIKLATPAGGEPDDIVKTVDSILGTLGKAAKGLPIGVCFPAVVINGTTMTAANVSRAWIGLEAEKLFEKHLGHDISFVNDADAAGYAETQYGAAKGVEGLVIMTTLGTGIGTALYFHGKLIQNAELGHIELEGVDWETKAAYSAKERENLDWADWAARLQKYYAALQRYLWPELIVVGGGVSKQYEDFLPLVKVDTRIVPAALRNNAGILGAAALAAKR